jgi:D-glycero-alpha-D-manno-heptose 1-phosphate guanylyltransferase
LSYVLRQLKAAGFRRAILCVGHGHDQIESWVSSFRSPELDIRFSLEDEPLGTAGAIRLAAERYPVTGAFVVMNGDSMLRLNFQKTLEFHRRSGALATVSLAWVSDTSRYGSVELNSTDSIMAFREKSESAAPGYINGGIYIFEPPVLERIPAKGAVSLERSVLPALCPEGLHGFKTDGYFLDIGVPDDYRRAQHEFRELKWL